MKKPTVKFFAFFLLTVISPLFSALNADAERLPVKIYTSADGLGSSFVDYIMRDSRGFMWFCTRDGLSRFDGSRFVTYQIGNQMSPPGIEGICETRDGIYWISTTGGSYRFNPNEISQPGAVTPRLNAEFITGGRGQFFEDSAGNLWLTSGVLSRVTEQDGKTILQEFELNLPPASNSALVIADLNETADGSLWMDTSSGLMRRLPDSRIVFYPIEAPISSGNSSMMVDKNGRI